MADEEIKEPEDAEGEEQQAESGSKKKLMLLGGGVVSILALAYITLLMAVPAKVTTPSFGPRFSVEFPLDPGKKITVNLRDNQMKIYLIMRLVFEARAYDEAYCGRRMVEPLYEPYMMSALISVCSAKTKSMVYGQEQQLAFLEELKEQVEPVLFPIHIGATLGSTDLDEESGLQPGLSSYMASFRGRFHEHVLKVDAPAKTLQIDDGPITEFVEGDANVLVRTSSGATVFVDVSMISPAYMGELNVGVHGQVVRLMAPEFVFQ